MIPDVPTMALMSAIAAITMGVAILALAWGRQGDGLGPWGAGLFLNGSSLILLSLRGRIPDLVSLVLGNAVLAASISLMLYAIWQFHGRRASAWLTVTPVVAITIAFAALADNLVGRVVVGGVIWGVQSGLVAQAAWRLRERTHGRGHLLIAIGFAAAGLMFLLRAVAIGGGWVAQPTFTSANVIQTLAFTTSMVAILMGSLGFVGMIKERTDERNRRLAMQDELTGIANRRALLETLERGHAAALRARAPLCLLMIDLDHFKRVNDQHGHLVGDVVLKGVVEKVQARLRAQDTLGRYGGEEFLVVLPGTTRAGGLAVAQALCERVRATEIPVGARSLRVTVSIGVHALDLDAAESVDAMIHAADEALYRAKTGGRDRACAAGADCGCGPGLAPGATSGVALA